MCRLEYFFIHLMIFFCLIDESCKWLNATNRNDIWSMIHDTFDPSKDIHYPELTFQLYIDKRFSSLYDVILRRRWSRYIRVSFFWCYFVQEMKRYEIYWGSPNDTPKLYRNILYEVRARDHRRSVNPRNSLVKFRVVRVLVFIEFSVDAE